jgi:hypothetical protein
VKVAAETPSSIAGVSRASPFLFRKLVAPAVGILALAILGVILIPAGVWHQPAIDAVYKGFDPNLVFVSPSGPDKVSGDITMSSDELTIAARPGSHPTVHLLTAPLSFTASFDAEILSEPTSSIPLQIEVWSPATSAGYFIVFDHDAGNVLTAESRVKGQSRQDLVAATTLKQEILGGYEADQPYHFTVSLDQPNRRISVLVIGPGSVRYQSALSSAEAPELFKSFRYTLTVSSKYSEGFGTSSSKATLRNFAVTLPHQSASSAEEAVKVDDSRVRLSALVLWFASIGLCLLAVLVWGFRFFGRTRGWSSFAPRWLRTNRTPLVAVAVALVLYVIGNAFLFGVATPHYDMVSSKIWAYDAYRYGLADLYYRTLLVPAAAAWQGVPVHEAGFPYGITKAYYYFAAAWIYRLGNPMGVLNISSFGLEALLKAANVIVGFVDGVFVYLILKPLVSRRTALISAILLVANPAVLIVMSLWGSTETISLFFVLGSILLAERQRPLAAWLMLAGAAYTRPQMLVVAFLLGLVYLRKFGVGRNLSAIPWTVIVAFVFIGPFAIAISPSLPVDYVARIFAYHIGNGQADMNYLGLSPANYSVWTIPMLWVSGQTELHRMWSPATMPLFGSTSYGQIGAVLSVSLLVVVGGILFFKKHVATHPTQYLPLIAFGVLGWTLVTPGVMSRYMVYALAALILCRAAFGIGAYLWLVVPVSVIASVSIFLHLADDFLGYSGGANPLSPTNNAISGTLYTLFSSDPFITFVSLSNVVLLLVLGWKAWAGLRSERSPSSAAAVPVAAV